MRALSLFNQVPFSLFLGALLTVVQVRSRTCVFSLLCTQSPVLLHYSAEWMRVTRAAASDDADGGLVPS